MPLYFTNHGSRLEKKRYLVHFDFQPSVLSDEYGQVVHNDTK